MKKVCAVIVDGISSGVTLAPAFRAFGVPCVHVLTSPALSKAFGARLIPTDFEGLFHCFDDEGLTKLITKLKNYSVVCVVPGTDSGVMLSDRLAEALKLKNANSAMTTGLRSNKFQSVDALEKSGIPAPKQRLIDIKSRETDILAEFEFPVIVKPIGSAGADNVSVCSDLDELVAALDIIFMSKSVYGQPILQAVVQERLLGQEFMVDSVSSDGHHKILMIWKVNRMPGKHPFGIFNTLLDNEDEDFLRIAAYVRDVLNNLGLMWGGANTELIMTKSGPKLIEINPRIHGSFSQLMATRAIGTTQPLEVARAYLAPGQFQKSSDQYMSPAMACGKVYLKSNVAGVVKNEPDWSLIKSLESFVGLQTSLAIGSVLRRTKDLASSPGVVYLAAANVPLLNRDYLAIREFEENSMYLNNCLGF